MNREEIKRVIIETLKPYGVERIAFFGSFARRDPAAHDVDVLIKFPVGSKRKPIGLRWFSLGQELEAKIGIPVDLVSEDSVPSRLRAQLDRDLEVIYEKAG